MRKTDKAHSACEFVAVLKIWDQCKRKDRDWAYFYLKNMATKARAYKRKSPHAAESKAREGV